MNTLDEIIDNSNDTREVKRALAVKMQQNEIAPRQIAALLNVSEQFISKWKVRFEQAGAAALRLAYTGSRSYLSGERRQATLCWIVEQETVTIEEVAGYLESEHKVEDQSKQSIYELLSEAGMSWHKSEKRHPKHDDQQVLERCEEIKKNCWRRKAKLKVKK